MSTVDDAVEAGARELWRASDVADHEWVMTSALAAAWPILSAGLRELHVREKSRYGPAHCFGCSQAAQAWVHWPCPTGRELDRIDKGLGA